MRVAIVVPTLNEESTISRTLPAAQAALAALAAQQPLTAGSELVVSDGGSRDRTVAVARALGARVVEGPAGRGGQLNRGAAATPAEILLLLHAHTTLPAGALQAIRAAIGGDDAGDVGAAATATTAATAANPAIGGAFLGRVRETGA